MPSFSSGITELQGYLSEKSFVLISALLVRVVRPSWKISQRLIRRSKVRVDRSLRGSTWVGGWCSWRWRPSAMCSFFGTSFTLFRLSASIRYWPAGAALPLGPSSSVRSDLRAPTSLYRFPLTHQHTNRLCDSRTPRCLTRIRCFTSSNS